jgi:DnaJ-class molecular chaperone
MVMRESVWRKNFYELLGIGQDATEFEIEVAYSDLSKIYDPESRFFADIIDEPVTDEQREIFERIKVAFSTLMNPDERKKYDQLLGS